MEKQMKSIYDSAEGPKEERRDFADFVVTASDFNDLLIVSCEKMRAIPAGDWDMAAKNNGKAGVLFYCKDRDDEGNYWIRIVVKGKAKRLDSIDGLEVLEDFMANGGNMVASPRKNDVGWIWLNFDPVRRQERFEEQAAYGNFKIQKRRVF